MTCRRLFALALTVLVALTAVSGLAAAMTAEEEALFNRAVAYVEGVVLEANQFAARGIRVIAAVLTVDRFNYAVRATNAGVGEYIQTAQSMIARINERFGVTLSLEHTDVDVYNPHLNLWAIVDPIHLLGSGG